MQLKFIMFQCSFSFQSEPVVLYRNKSSSLTINAYSDIGSSNPWRRHIHRFLLLVHNFLHAALACISCSAPHIRVCVCSNTEYSLTSIHRVLFSVVSGVGSLVVVGAVDLCLIQRFPVSIAAIPSYSCCLLRLLLVPSLLFPFLRLHEPVGRGVIEYLLP